MQLRAMGDWLTFEHLLDQIDAATRPVEFVAEQLIGRAGRVAETAVHAGPQDGLGFTAFVAVFDEIGEVGFHARRFSNQSTCGRD